MSFDNIIGTKLVQIDTKKKPTTKKKTGVGCDNCPSDKAKHVHKIFGKVKGKKLFIFGMAPSRDDNKKRKELTGKSGDFLWDELKTVGIKREDCDIQNVVRCFPCDHVSGTLVMRNPSKEELKCCSKYTEEALAKSKAKVYLLLGAVAAKQVLGKEYKASQKIFWSDKLKARVYCLYNPGYFVRGMNTEKALKEFREQLKQLGADVSGKGISTQYGYIEKQDYKGITTVKAAKKEAHLIRRVCREQNVRVSIDLEDDVINGKKVALCLGACIKPGRSRTFIIDHPQAVKVHGKWEPLKRKVRDRIVKYLKSFIEDEKIEKVMHHGSYDTPNIEAELHTKPIKYKFDTNYSKYLADPDVYGYGLAALTQRDLPKFGDYKTIILPECIPHDFDIEKAGLKNAPPSKVYAAIAKTGLLRLSQLPLKKLVLYNGADCDATKRFEISTKNKVNLALLEIYTDVAFVLDEMTPNGPYFDSKHYKKLKELYPPKLERLLKRIRKAAGDPEFNPGSPQQVSEFIYKKLKLGGKHPEDTSTAKGIMEVFAVRSKEARDILDFRKVAKIISTYMHSYKACAKMNGGRLRTIWWLTGTRTGRLSSGGGKGKKDSNNKVINLQNVINDPLLQNLCVPDAQWNKLYETVGKLVTRTARNGFMYDLTMLYFKALKRPKEKDKYKGRINDALNEIRKKLIKDYTFVKKLKRLIRKLGNIRVAFGLDEGQIEVRVAAQASGDKNLIADCKKGDIHSQVGHTLTGWSVEKIKKDKKTRTLTKNCHFGILFGLAKDALYEFIKAKDPDMTMTREEVGDAYDRYFKRYSKMAEFIKNQRAYAEKNGNVENMFGFTRKLFIPDATKEDFGETSGAGGAFWGNQAVNTVIQGAAHHLMLFALSVMKTDPKRAKKDILGVPGMEVHDALYFWVKLKNLAKALVAGKYLLEKIPLQVVKAKYPKIKWLVPLEVDARVGFRLGDMIEYDPKTNIEDIMLSMYFETLKAEARLQAEIKYVKEAA